MRFRWGPRCWRAAMVPLLVVAVAACGAQPAQSPAPPPTLAAQPTITVTAQADSTVVVTAQAASTVTATSADPATEQADSTVAATATAADTAGLVPAEYPQCDIGAQILRYLQTGDNGGDPQLDVQFANYVGASPAQARALADQAIQQCDQQAATQQSSQAYAQSTSAAAASASAAQAQQDAATAAQKQQSCAAIGGRVDQEFGGAGVCASTVPGDPSGQPGAECASAYVTFSLDGTLDSDSYKTAKHDHAGCFQ